MTYEQQSAVACAMADLIGSYQAQAQQDPQAHDWDAHRQSIDDLLRAFPELLDNWTDTINQLED